MGTNDLVAEVGKHVPYAEIMDDAKWCIHCADEWPCVTRRLADALEASEDAELQAIEVVLTVCNGLDDLDAANRVLNYAKERMQER